MIRSSGWESPFRDTVVSHSARVKGLLLFTLLFSAVFAASRFLEPVVVRWLLSYVPREADKSIAFYRDLLHLAFSELLWFAGLLVLTCFFVAYIPLNRFMEWMESRVLKISWIYTGAIIALSFGVSLVIVHFALEQFPNSSDEYVYLYQAQTLSEGRLWDEAHPYPDFFHFNNIAQKDGIRAGRFPPGWPAVISVAFTLGIAPYWINLLLGALSLILFYRVALSLYGPRVALWSMPVLALTSCYIFNSASFFSHTSNLLCVLLFVLGVYEYRQKEKIVHLLMAGFALGIMVTIRYYTALIVFFPFFFFLIYQYRFRAISVFFWLGIAALPCVAAGLWYTYAITGNPMLPVTMWAYKDEALGFVRGHTLLKGIEHVIRWLLMFVYWCSPSLLILYFVFLWKKLSSPVQRLLHPEDYIFVLLMMGYFFYYEIGGNQYGPRFFFESFPFLVLMVVAAAIKSRERWAMALLIAGTIYSVAKLPFIAVREHRVVQERNDLYNQVKAEGITHAVIFISTHTGVIRPMPAGDLTRNDATFSNDVLYALDLKEKNKLLMDYYPGRKFYRYIKDEESVEGRLVQIK